MKILAIETSCDETAIAIAEFFGTRSRTKIRLLANVISSQVKLHAKYGGVVPNLAKREHQKNLPVVLLKALRIGRFLTSKIQIPNAKQIQNSKLKIINRILEREPELLKQFKKTIQPLSAPKIDAIAVTVGPGLAPALWVGVNFARALSHLWKKPLIPVNHMAGHVYSPLLQIPGNLEPKTYTLKPLRFPAIALLVSGGHTELVLVKNYGKHKIIGETLDDAAGEAFDKVARLLKLGYPGGPEISQLAEKGTPKKYPLPSPLIHSKDYNFSFSGLKTAVLYFIRDHKKFNKADLAASFEKAIVDVLMKKTVRAAKEYKARTMLLGGGVAANQPLRRQLGAEIKRSLPNTCYLLPHTDLTGDNALMIALAAFFAGKPAPWGKKEASPNLRL